MRPVRGRPSVGSVHSRGNSGGGCVQVVKNVCMFDLIAMARLASPGAGSRVWLESAVSVLNRSISNLCRVSSRRGVGGGKG